ncbi:hypothetical protein BT69DRAFT_1316624 [Atractiella rhizophila]|nr:hypothetical protein BT69DRAFT_1316624 [Atractiella rhizophila]
MSATSPQHAGAIEKLLSKYIQAFYGRPELSDIVFTFPDDLWKPKAKLYANKRFLSSMSPMFKTMFESGFKESRGRIGKPATTAILNTSFRTFAVFLRYIQTNQHQDQLPYLILTSELQFRMVFSYESYVQEDPQTGYQKDLEDIVDVLRAYEEWNDDTTLCADPDQESCDPIELYVLADTYEVEALKQQIRNQLHRYLTPQSAYDALFNTPSLIFSELREVILSYVKTNWYQVRRTPAVLNLQMFPLASLSECYHFLPHGLELSLEERRKTVREINMAL